jgi:hypothetical protein
MDVAPAFTLPWGVIAVSAVIFLLLLATWLAVKGRAPAGHRRHG